MEADRPLQPSVRGAAVLPYAPLPVACLCVNVLVALPQVTPPRFAPRCLRRYASRVWTSRGQNAFRRAIVRVTCGTEVGQHEYRVRSHLFRAWTACAILAAYVYGWLYVPETLTWWKRTTTTIIEDACDHLPYPWGDRIEATIGNFGLWVQITLAIVAFRILVWIVISALRRMGSLRPRG